jgi:hypothetical protein
VLEWFEQHAVGLEVAWVIAQGCDPKKEGSGGEQVGGGLARSVGVGQVVVSPLAETRHDAFKVKLELEIAGEITAEWDREDSGQ